MDVKIYSREEHTVSRKNIDSEALKILYRLDRSGFKGYLVGGGVRDLLLGKKPKDFDIATDATPRRIKSLFSNSRIIGRRFKLVHIYFYGNKIIEVSTFRDQTSIPDTEDPEDVEPIRNDNTYGNEETDAARRDITINGLFYDISTFSVIDYVGGMKDLKDKLIRVIGEPSVRFAEDPVRLIRVVRHAVRSGFSIEKKCLESLQENRALILKSPKVRVYDELKKDLCSGHTLGILRKLIETGLMEFLIPDLVAGYLSEKAPLAECLERIDEINLNSQEFPVPLVLAVIALFTKAEASTDTPFYEVFDSEDMIEDHLLRLFKSLSVTRKEKERISGALRAWIWLQNNSKQESIKTPLWIRSFLEDTQLLLRVLPHTPHDRSILKKIEHLEQEFSSSSSRRKGRRPRYSQRPRKSVAHG